MSTPDGWRILAVMPALNEQGSIASVVAEARAAQPNWGVVVVDDGCTDATAAVAREAGAIVLSHPFNLGVGAAMRTGMQYARQEGYDVVVQIDADGQHPADALDTLIAPLRSGADVVIGSRFASDDNRYEASGIRRLGMLLLRWSIKRRTGLDLPDVTSGFRAHGPKAVHSLVDRYPAEYLSDTIESLLMAHRDGLVIEVVPVDMRQRQAGQASQGPLRSAAYLGRVMMLLLATAGHRRATRATANERPSS